jgi:hypothetical protein
MNTKFLTLLSLLAVVSLPILCGRSETTEALKQLLKEAANSEFRSETSYHEYMDDELQAFYARICAGCANNYSDIKNENAKAAFMRKCTENCLVSLNSKANTLMTGRMEEERNRTMFWTSFLKNLKNQF